MTAAHTVPLPPTTSRRSALALWALALTALLGLCHMSIDGACTFTIGDITGYTGFHTGVLIVGIYNALAFATQFGLGWGVDRLGIARGAAIAGCLMTAAGTLLRQHAPAEAIMLCGLGNALFHVGAGAIVLNISRGSAGLPGLFVAPGSIGVLVGTNVGWGVWQLSPWVFIAACLAAIMPIMAAGRMPAPLEAQAAVPPRPAHRRDFVWLTFVAALLLFSVGSRSLMGGYFPSSAEATVLAVAPYVIETLGKAVSGFVADALGWIAVSVGAALAAIPLFALAPPHGAWPLVALALVQVPMPVTLAALARLYPRRPGMVFGLTAVMVWAGSLPIAKTLIPSGNIWAGAALPAACALALLVSLLMLRRGLAVERKH